MLRASLLSLVLATYLVSSEAKTRNLQNNKESNTGTNYLGDIWTRTVNCNCYEYMTDEFFRLQKYDFDTQRFDHHKYDEGTVNQNIAYDHLMEFCCEFAAELVDPKCSKNALNQWVNKDGQPPHADVENMICDLFAMEPVRYRTTLMQQARDACFCFYRHHGCGREELGHGGYCDYPHSEVTLDDFRMANNSALNMCNACLENDSNKQYLYPTLYEGRPHGHCFGYCMLKRGDPKQVYRPNVTDERCDFEDKAKGLKLHGFDENHPRQEITFNPFKQEADQKHDYFFQAISMGLEANAPSMSLSSRYEIIIEYDGLDRSYMKVQRFDGDYAKYDMTEFPLLCQPEDWDILSIHVFDESADGGIAFRDVTLDGVDLGDFGFVDTDGQIMPDDVGMPGHNYTCVTRPGGYGHMSGFVFRGYVEVAGTFADDDVGLELIVGCSRKQHVHGGSYHDDKLGPDSHHYYHDFRYDDVTPRAEKWMNYPVPEKLKP